MSPLKDMHFCIGGKIKLGACGIKWPLVLVALSPKRYLCVNNHFSYQVRLKVEGTLSRCSSKRWSLFHRLALFDWLTATGDGDNIMRFCPAFHVVQLMKGVCSQFDALFSIQHYYIKIWLYFPAKICNNEVNKWINERKHERTHARKHTRTGE